MVLSGVGLSRARAVFCLRPGLARMMVFPAGPKGSSFELIVELPTTRGNADYKTLSHRTMTFAADPQVNQPYPLGELSYVIVISEVAD
jgi:hypothetical protein